MIGLDAADLALMAAAFAGGVVSGLTGFAFSLVAAGVFMQVLPPATAAALLIAGPFVLQSFGIAALWRAVRWERLWPFLAAGIVGIPIGVEIVQGIDAKLFRHLVGGFLVAYGAYMLVRPQPAPVAWGGRAADAGIGFVGGVMGGMSGFAGAVPTIWCGIRGWPKDEQRGVYQPFIVLTQLLALLWLLLQGAVDRAAAAAFATILPAMLAGLWLGFRLYGRLDDARFRRVVLWLLLVSGASLVLS